VPQVASDPTIHAHSRTTPRQAPPAQQLTARLLDDGASPAAAPAPESKTAFADRAPSQSNDWRTMAAQPKRRTGLVVPIRSPAGAESADTIQTTFAADV